LALSSNYALTFVGADLTINVRPITVTADAKSKTYGDADPVLTYQITSGSLAFSDAFSGSLSRAAGESVAAYAVGQGTLALNSNYNLSFIGADLTINARAITVHGGWEVEDLRRCGSGVDVSELLSARWPSVMRSPAV
jgi:hypothetical protein